MVAGREEGSGRGREEADKKEDRVISDEGTRYLGASKTKEGSVEKGMPKGGTVDSKEANKGSTKEEGEGAE